MDENDAKFEEKELDFDDKGPGDKASSVPTIPRKPGRRERKEEVAGESMSTETIGKEDATGMIAVAGGKPGRRRRGDDGGGEAGDSGGGGWMNMSSSSDRKKTRETDILEDDAPEAIVAVNKNKHKDDDELILIPDLDEDGIDDDKRVAHAPKNIHRKIPTLSELNNDVKTVISSTELGYDLGVLLNALVPAEFLNESDTLWTFESLLQEVTEEFQKNDNLILEDGINAL